MSNPDMIGGPERFDTDIMTAGRGSLVSKVGAEGFYGIGVQPGKVPGTGTSLGIAVKISDGDLTWRAGCVVAVEILKHLGVLSKEQVAEVKEYYRRPVYNWRNMEVGEIRPSEELVAALSKFIYEKNSPADKEIYQKAQLVYQKLRDFYGIPEWRQPLPPIDELVSTILVSKHK